MLGGTMISWASVKPATGTFVGQTVSGGVVKYQVVDGTAIDYKAKNLAGDEVDVKAYPVEISGLDYDGLTAKNLTELNIATSFTEKYGDELNGYYVTRIIDTQGTTDPQDVDGILYKKAFYAMTDLTSLTFAADANGLAADKFTFSVGNYAFYGCTSLETLVLPDNVNKIGKYAFQGTVIKDFTIPAKCETIGACAFNDTKKLGTVTVSTAGNSVLTTIDQQVFANSFVSKLDLSNATALESINDQAFIFNVSDVNAQLKEVILPNVTDPLKRKFASLGANGTCFANCMALTTIGNLDKTIIPEIKPGAFQNCVELTELNLPATASIITDYDRSNMPAEVVSPFLNTPKLATITFADGWGYTGPVATNVVDNHREIIEPGVYYSTNGKKIKYNSSTKKYELEAYTLSETDLANELSHLKTIEFKGKVYGTIDDEAFGNQNIAPGTTTPAELACTGLTTVQFDGLICQGTLINPYAFANCAKLATLTFNGFVVENNKCDDILIKVYAFAGTAIKTVAFNGFTFNGNATASNFRIMEHAFACDNLETVEFGDILFNDWNNGTSDQAGAANEFKLNNYAFESDLLKKVTFGAIKNTANKKKGTGAGKFTLGDDNGTYPVFAPKTEWSITPATALSTGVLEEVEFGEMTTGVYTINKYACSSEVLKKVKFADVTTISAQTGSLTIGDYAFGYPTVSANRKATNPKVVEIGSLIEPLGNDGKKPNAAKILTVTIGNAAFYGDLLTTVTIGEMRAGNITIGDADGATNAPFGGDFAVKTVTISDITSEKWTIKSSAFSGKQLVGVSIGDIDPKYGVAANTASIAGFAFANTSVGTDNLDPMPMIVSIGKLNNDKLAISANAFKGPQIDGSVYGVAIGAEVFDNAGKLVRVAGLEKLATISAGAFAGPAVGESSYTIGDINDTETIEAGAFAGSLDEEGKTASSVTIGDYNQLFVTGTFTKVNDVTTGDWNVASLMLKFDGIRQLTVNGDVTKQLNGGDYNTLESITIAGNVSASIGANGGGFGTAVRKIEFTAEDPEVIAGAIREGSFEKASDDCIDKNETITVIYRVKTAKKSNAIFDQKAFNATDDGVKNVVLYTDQWSLEHTFQNVEIGGAAEQVYRIMLSASDVAPGQDIEATCVKGANGKYSYGRLYIPAGKGMRYMVSAEYDEATKKNGVNLFSASISGTDIYMHQLTVMNGSYWIDATESAQTLIVRTSDVSADKVTVEAESVSEDDAQAMDAAGTVILDNDWFDAASAKKNALKYATSDITPAEFQNDAATYNKGIYVMANPAKNNLAFALYNQTLTGEQKLNDLKKGSVYVVTRANQYARLNVIWPEDIDEESDATAIKAIESEESNDAIYNLQGVRVNNAQKGIFIINGKKVVK